MKQKAVSSLNFCHVNVFFVLFLYKLSYCNLHFKDNSGLLQKRCNQKLAKGLELLLFSNRITN